MISQSSLSGPLLFFLSLCTPAKSLEIKFLKLLISRVSVRSCKWESLWCGLEGRRKGQAIFPSICCGKVCGCQQMADVGIVSRFWGPPESHFRTAGSWHHYWQLPAASRHAPEFQHLELQAAETVGSSSPLTPDFCDFLEASSSPSVYSSLPLLAFNLFLIQIPRVASVFFLTKPWRNQFSLNRGMETQLLTERPRKIDYMVMVKIIIL